MKKFAAAMSACVAGLLLGASASAAPITYAFSGTVYGNADLSGQTVAGTYTFDPALYTGSYTDGSTIKQG